MRLRNLFNSNFNNSSYSRSLLESILVPEVGKAFNDWENMTIGLQYVLIGGVALSYYVKPRTTTDIDVLFMSNVDIPATIKRFKHHRPGAFQHNSTHVEIEVLTPDSINMPHTLANEIYHNAKIVNNVRVASIAGLIISKLGRFKLQDQADIEELLLLDKNPDMTVYTIPPLWVDRYTNLRTQLGI
jgi:hypothetical protein